jgi:hypothetical protein
VQVHFTCSGDAEILNPGSIGITEAGIATALIRIGETPEEIIIKAKSANLSEGVIKFISY